MAEENKVRDKYHHDKYGGYEDESIAIIEKEPISKSTMIVAIALFLASFLARLFVIYFVTNPDNPGVGWFGDAYHHWQIAYLSKTIGFNQSFLRLWDLKGMEYFWGLLHPLFTIAAFAISGSISVGVERAMTAFWGSISVSLIYLIAKREWNVKTALAASLFAAFNPVGVFNDGTGMVEPIGIPFLLLGIYFWPFRPFLSGFSLFVALTARAEYWIFSLGMVFAFLFFSGKRIKLDHKAVMLLGFFIPLLVYAKYLLDYTGNPIYPFYWNYVTNIYGTWQLKPELTSEDLAARFVFRIIIAITAFSIAWVLKKKPKGKFLYLLGLGNWFFLALTFGVGAYIKSYMSYVWYVRFMILPYIFIGVVLSVILFYTLPKIKFVRLLDKMRINWLIMLAIILMVQPVWSLILGRYSETKPAWEATVSISEKIAKNYNGGGLLLMEGNPEITYALVKVYGVKGEDIVGQMFDPYFYFPEDEDPYNNWEENRVVVLNWLKENNIRTIVTYQQYDRYLKLSEKEPNFVSEGHTLTDTNLIIFNVKDDLYQTQI